MWDTRETEQKRVHTGQNNLGSRRVEKGVSDRHPLLLHRGLKLDGAIDDFAESL